MQLKMRKHEGASTYSERETWYEVVDDSGSRRGWVRRNRGNGSETFPWQAYRAGDERGPDGGPTVGDYVGAWYGAAGAKADAMHAAAGLGP